MSRYESPIGSKLKLRARWRGRLLMLVLASTASSGVLSQTPAAGTSASPSVRAVPAAPAAGARSVNDLLTRLPNGSGKPSAALVQAAAKESGLVWYDTFTADQANEIYRAFQAAYPAIKGRLGYVTVQAAETTGRALRESQSGVPTADFIRSSWELFQTMIPGGFLAPVTAAELMLPKEQFLQDNVALTGMAVYGIQYNTNLAKGADVPKAWNDLLNPKWQGKIGLWSAAAPFVNLAFELGPDKTRAYLEALKTQKPQIFPSPAALSSAIVSGQIAVGVNAVRFAQTAKADGAPTDGSYPNPVAVTPYYSAIVKAGKNTNTAKLFLSWLLSEPGAAVFEKVTGQGSPHVPGTQASKTFEKLTLSGPPPTGAGGTTAAGYNKEFSAILAR